MIDFFVPSLRRTDIRQIAHSFRLSLDSGIAYFDIVEFLDIVVPKSGLFPGFTIEISGTEEDLGNVHGLAKPDENKIILPSRTYDGARAGVGRDRMTLAHEFGHICLHKNIDPAFARTTSRDIPAYSSAEWQAKAFAAEFMIPHVYIAQYASMESVADKFGVSIAAARYQLNQYRKEGLI